MEAGVFQLAAATLRKAPVEARICQKRRADSPTPRLQMEIPCWILLRPGENARFRVRYVDNVYAAGYGSSEFFVLLPDNNLVGEHQYIRRSVPDSVFLAEEEPEFAEVTLGAMNYLDFAYLEFRFDFIKLNGEYFVTKRNCLNLNQKQLYFSSLTQVFAVLRQTVDEDQENALKLLFRAVEMYASQTPLQLRVCGGKIELTLNQNTAIDFTAKLAILQKYAARKFAPNLQQLVNFQNTAAPMLTRELNAAFEKNVTLNFDKTLYFQNFKPELQILDDPDLILRQTGSVLFFSEEFWLHQNEPSVEVTVPEEQPIVKIEPVESVVKNEEPKEIKAPAQAPATMQEKTESQTFEFHHLYDTQSQQPQVNLTVDLGQLLAFLNQGAQKQQPVQQQQPATQTSYNLTVNSFNSAQPGATARAQAPALNPTAVPRSKLPAQKSALRVSQLKSSQHVVDFKHAGVPSLQQPRTALSRGSRRRSQGSSHSFGQFSKAGVNDSLSLKQQLAELEQHNARAGAVLQTQGQLLVGQVENLNKSLRELQLIDEMTGRRPPAPRFEGAQQSQALDVSGVLERLAQCEKTTLELKSQLRPAQTLPKQEHEVQKWAFMHDNRVDDTSSNRGSTLWSRKTFRK